MPEADEARPAPVGTRFVDSTAKGARIGLFAGSGVGKSTLLGQIACRTNADVNVVMWSWCGQAATSLANIDIYLKAYYHDWDTDYYPAGDKADSAFWGFQDVGLTAAARVKVAPGLVRFAGKRRMDADGTLHPIDGPAPPPAGNERGCSA